MLFAGPFKIGCVDSACSLDVAQYRWAGRLPNDLHPSAPCISFIKNVPASLADACLVRMSELHEPFHMFTLDGNSYIYRRYGRKVIPVICPIT